MDRLIWVTTDCDCGQNLQQVLFSSVPRLTLTKTALRRCGLVQNQTKPLEEQRPRLNTISTQKVLELHHFPAEVHHGRAPAGGLGGGLALPSEAWSCSGLHAVKASYYFLSRRWGSGSGLLWIVTGLL